MDDLLNAKISATPISSLVNIPPAHKVPGIGAPMRPDAKKQLSALATAVKKTLGWPMAHRESLRFFLRIVSPIYLASKQQMKPYLPH